MSQYPWKGEGDLEVLEDIEKAQEAPVIGEESFPEKSGCRGENTSSVGQGRWWCW